MIAAAITTKRERTLVFVRLYSRLGWTRVGDIPNYALFPSGGPCSTTIFYRDLEGDIHG